MKTMIRTLREGGYVTDREFDQIFPDKIRSISKMHWTPIEVARRAAQLLALTPDTRVLDIGSGAGKFCLVGALTTQANFFGIEQRPRLAEIARNISKSFEIHRVEFIDGDIRSLDWNSFQSFYLFNPFVEHLKACDYRIDDQIEFCEKIYTELIRWVQYRLHRLPIHTRIVTYHGFGGEMPPGYRLEIEEPGDGDFLRLWIKVDH